MTKTARSMILLSSVAALGSCGPTGSGLEAPSPARALVAGVQNGTLDSDRLACTVEHLPAWLDAEMEQLPALRRQRAAQRAAMIGKMAESMQRNMAAADLAYWAGSRNVALTNEAIASHQRGEHTGAAGRSALAMEWSAAATHPERQVEGGTARFARLTSSSRGFAALGRLLNLSDADLAVLPLYARERAAQVTDPGSVDLDRLAAWDRDHPAVMETFAELVLSAYHMSGPPCEGAR